MPDDVEVRVLFVFWRIKTEEFEKVLVSTWPKYRGLPQVNRSKGRFSTWSTELLVKRLTNKRTVAKEKKIKEVTMSGQNC